MIAIQMATADHLPYIIEAAAREGWNPGLSDATTFLAADPEGFLVAVEDGRPVGCISRVRYGSDLGFIGLYIVEPRLRGQGLGAMLWDRAMAELGGRIIGLDGVVAMQDAYRRSGFVLAHRNIRFAGPVPAGITSPASVRVASATDVDALVAYDSGCFGADRAAFLRAWLAAPGTRAVVAHGDHGVSGFAVVRPCRDGSKFGPLFADDPQVARELFAAGSATLVPGSTRILDVPEPNEAGVGLAHAAGMSPAFETARMYAGGDPRLPLARIFGITSFELG